MVRPAQAETLRNDQGVPEREYLAELVDQAFTDRIDDSLLVVALDRLDLGGGEAGSKEVVAQSRRFAEHLLQEPVEVGEPLGQLVGHRR